MQDWEARIQLLSHSAHLQTEILGRDEGVFYDYPLYALTWGDPIWPMVLVAAGVHGDEPEGVEAALRLLEEIDQGATPLTRHRLVVLPCLNPSGFALGTRTNGAGQDINRQFHTDLTEITAAVRRLLPTLTLDLLVDLHTDLAVNGFYLFQLLHHPAESLAPAVLAAITAAGYSLEEAPFYAGLVGKHGLLAPTTKQLKKFERFAVGASLAQWGWGIDIPWCYVFETPNAVVEMGVRMHLTALRALFIALEDTE